MYRSQNPVRAWCVCGVSDMLGRRFYNRQDRPGRRAGRMATLLVGLLLIGGLHGCYWLKYEKLMRTHVELMLAMTDKLSRLIEARDAEPVSVPPTMMNEFFYPLERARDFVRIVAPRSADRASLHAFTVLLDTYERLLREADLRRVQPGRLDEFQRLVQACREQADRVESALAAE